VHCEFSQALLLLTGLEFGAKPSHLALRPSWHTTPGILRGRTINALPLSLTIRIYAASVRFRSLYPPLSSWSPPPSWSWVAFCLFFPTS